MKKLVLLFFLMISMNTNSYSFTKTAYVTNRSYLYESYTNTNNTSSANIVDIGQYEVLDEYSDYYKVNVYDDIHKILFSGWIKENTIKSNIVIKKTPLLESNLSTVIANINKNSCIMRIVDKNFSWIKIKSNNKIGWLYKNKFKFIGGDLW